jgi:hypothetical protein
MGHEAIPSGAAMSRSAFARPLGPDVVERIDHPRFRSLEDSDCPAEVPAIATFTMFPRKHCGQTVPVPLAE